MTNLIQWELRKREGREGQKGRAELGGRGGWSWKMTLELALLFLRGRGFQPQRRETASGVRKRSRTAPGPEPPGGQGPVSSASLGPLCTLACRGGSLATPERTGLCGSSRAVQITAECYKLLTDPASQRVAQVGTAKPELVGPCHAKSSVSTNTAFTTPLGHTGTCAQPCRAGCSVCTASTRARGYHTGLHGRSAVHRRRRR